MKYLVGSQDFEFEINGAENISINAFSDADWAGFFIGKCPLYISGFLVRAGNSCRVKSRTAFPDVIVLLDCLREAENVRHLVEDAGYKSAGPITLHGDRKTA